MLDLWEFEYSEWGVVAQYNAYTIRVIKNPIKSGWQMSVNAMDKQADTIIDMLRTDAVASGLYGLVQSNPATKRPVVTIGASQYTLNALENDDDTQPSVRFKAMLLQ